MKSPGVGVMAGGGLPPAAGQQPSSSVTGPSSWSRPPLAGPLQGRLTQEGFNKPALGRPCLPSPHPAWALQQHTGGRQPAPPTQAASPAGTEPSHQGAGPALGNRLSRQGGNSPSGVTHRA